jgi:hypothetical protein
LLHFALYLKKYLGMDDEPVGNDTPRSLQDYPEQLDDDLFLLPNSSDDQSANFDHSMPPPSMNNSEAFSSVPSMSQFSNSLQNESQQMSIASSSVRRVISSPIKRGEVSFIVPGITSVSKSERRCFVCRSPTGRSRIPNSALLDTWLKLKILVPENNRICADHLDSGIFTEEALSRIIVTKESAELNGQQVAKWLTNLSLKLSQRHRLIDFNSNAGLPNEDVKMLTGIDRNAFQALVNVLKTSKMRESANRSLQNALGIFMILLRLNLSQRVIAFLFGVSQSVVSDAIDAVSEVLLEKFVPLHLGYEHLSREQIMNHMRPTFTTILERDEEDMILILDGTYLYAEKSSNFYLQRRSFSSHKNRNLFKPMMVVCPDGYVIEADGLYFSDGVNNDSKILEDMWKKDNSVLSRDCLILDRGFRDVIPRIEASKVATFCPKFLPKGQKQFTAEEANHSRKITKLRWVVESANGRLKNVFSFFYETIPASYFPKLNRFLRIALSIQNAFFPPLFTETEAHTRIAESMLRDETGENHVLNEIRRLKIENSRVDWLPATEDDCLEFPMLTMEELETITLGKYQLAMGRRYNLEHTDAVGYKFSVHRDLPGLLRVRMQSRFSKINTHVLWIQFKEHVNGLESIEGYYCKCKSGSRTLGCCSHVASVRLLLIIELYFSTLMSTGLTLSWT